MNLPEQAKMLVQYVEAAQRQLKYIEPRRRDQDFEKKGGTLLYAVDTDIVKLFTSPAEVSVAKNGREGYAQIFPDEPPEISAAIGAALAYFIFFELTKNTPLLAIPPLNEEIRNVYQGVTHDASKEQKRADSQEQELERLLKEITQDRDDAGTIGKVLQEKAPDIFRILTKSGYTQELDRFNELFGSGRLVPPGYFLENEQSTTDMLKEALAPADQTWESLCEFRDLRNAWDEALREVKSPHRKAFLLYNDATALARLERINERMDENTRLILITGDQSLMEAARRIHEKCSHFFADCYLRHPRSYLADLLLLKSSNKHVDNDLIGWLEMLRNTLGSDQHVPAEKMRIAEQTLRDSPDLLEKFQQKWSDYSRSIMLSPVEAETTNNNINSMLWQLLSTKCSDDMYGHLKEELEKIIGKSRESLIKVITKAGFSLLLHSESRSQLVRNVPLLRFSSFTKAQDFVKSVVQNGRFPSADEQSLKEPDDDPNDYTFYLVYAVLYAYKDMWIFTKKLAEYATQLVDKNRAPKISGREAHYLLSVAIRHTCRISKGLAAAQKHLKMAEERVKSESHHDERMDEDIRFISEEIAIHLTYRLYEKFQGESLPDNIPSLKNIQKAAVEALKDMQNQEEGKEDSQNQEEGKEDPQNQEEGKEDPQIYHFAERNLLTNYFMATFMLGNYADKKYKDTYEDLFKRFKNNVGLKNAPKLSYLVEVIYNMAGWLSDPEPKEYHHNAKLLLEQKPHSVMPYDSARFEFLEKILKKETSA